MENGRCSWRTCPSVPKAELLSWSLDIVTVPEPSVWVFGIMGLGLLAGMGKISGRGKTK